MTIKIVFRFPLPILKRANINMLMYAGPIVQLNVNHSTTYTDELFIMAEVSVESSLHFGCADNRRMVHQLPQILSNNTH